MVAAGWEAAFSCFNQKWLRAVCCRWKYVHCRALNSAHTHKRVCTRARNQMAPCAWLLYPGAKAHYGKYEPTILELKRKYESAMKEKMLAGLERDKMAAKVGFLFSRESWPVLRLANCQVQACARAPACAWAGT